jgi:hypothetical protein
MLIECLPKLESRLPSTPNNQLAAGNDSLRPTKVQKCSYRELKKRMTFDHVSSGLTKNPGGHMPDTFLQLALNMSHRPLLETVRVNSVAEFARAKPLK